VALRGEAGQIVHAVGDVDRARRGREITETTWRYSLMNWGHDAAK
jgi:hypothetical protein